MQAPPESHWVPALVQLVPTVSVVVQGGAPDDVPPLPDGARHTGGPHVAYHFRLLDAPPLPLVPPEPVAPPKLPSHGGKDVVHSPFTHAPVAQELPPFGHCLQTAGTAHSPLVLQPELDAPPELATPPLPACAHVFTPPVQ